MRSGKLEPVDLSYKLKESLKVEFLFYRLVAPPALYEYVTFLFLFFSPFLSLNEISLKLQSSIGMKIRFEILLIPFFV